MAGGSASTLSVLIPVWNEQVAIASVLREWGATPLSRYTPLFILDDGSTDGTAEIALQIAAGAQLVRVVRLPHGGKDAALWRGIAIVTTDWAAFMDGDGQYDPNDIERLLNYALEVGADAVWGIRATREDTFFRRIASRMGRCLKRVVLKRCIVCDPGCGLFVVRRHFAILAVQSIPVPHGQVHCHLAEIVAACGGTVRQMAILHRKRTAGCAKFAFFNRLIPGWRSLLQAHAVIVQVQQRKRAE